MIFKLLNAENGCVLEITSDDKVERILYQDSDDESASIHRFRDFLWELTSTYGPTTSRYSKERIHIEVVEGDKYE